MLQFRLFWGYKYELFSQKMEFQYLLSNTQYKSLLAITAQCTGPHKQGYIKNEESNL